jgi:oligosaccharyltransferase complex subunit beta
VDSGRHLIIAGSSEASDTIRSLALECGVEFDDKGTALYDHFSHQAAGGASDPTLVATSHIVESKAVFGDQQPKVCVWGRGGV